MSKSKKTVERQKTKKNDKPIADIIAIKQPLSKGAQNINKNTQNVIIQFPDNIELRRVKKKKKTKPKDNKRKELLEELKKELENYDNIQAEVRKKNIKIPENLGLTMISTSQLKTNDDILKFIKDVTLKAEGLKKLLSPQLEQRIQQPNRTGTQEPIRYIGGVPVNPNLFRPPPVQLPPVQLPQQIQSISPYNPTQTPPPVQPPTQPPAQPPNDDIQSQLQQMTSEIQAHLGPDANIPPPPQPQQQLQPAQQPGGVVSDGGAIISNIPVAPVVMQSFAPPKTSELQKIKGAMLGGMDSASGAVPVDLLAPNGWYTIYHRFEKFQNDVGYRDKERFSIGDPKYNLYHIPLEDYNKLLKERNELRDDYKLYLNSLPENQANFILTDTNLKRFDEIMTRGLNAEPKAILAEQLQKQGIPFTEITQGNEQPKQAIAIQKGTFNDPAMEKERTDFESYIATRTTDLKQLMNQIEQKQHKGVKMTQEEKQGDENIVFAYEEQMRDKFAALSPEVQIESRVAYDKFLKRSNDVISIINIGKTTDPTKSSMSSSKLEKVKQQQLQTLINYIENTDGSKLYTQKMKRSLLELIGDAETETIMNTKKQGIIEFKSMIARKLNTNGLPNSTETLNIYKDRIRADEIAPPYRPILTPPSSPMRPINPNPQDI